MDSTPQWWNVLDANLNLVLLTAVIAALLYKMVMSAKKKKAATSTIENDVAYKVGELIDLSVDDLEFGLPRCKVQMKDLPSVAEMLSWNLEKFKDEIVEVAHVPFGTFTAWVVQGMKFNRILYAAKKRGDVVKLPCVVVAPANVFGYDKDGDFTGTHGSSVSQIQLIP